MKAFHNDSAIKEKYLARVRAHALADEIIKGQYWEGGKGCAVGCTIHSADHEAYETELGIPEIIARLEDRIFEGLPLDLAKTWPERFLQSIQPGADLTFIWDKFASRLLTDPVGGVIQYAKTKEQLEVIQRVSDLYRDRSSGIIVDKQKFADAADAADAAAYAAYAAYAAANAADADADAAYAAANAAYAYADAAAADTMTTTLADARQKAYTWQSKLLLELLRDSK